MPEKSFWAGTVELAPGVHLPFQMYLDLEGKKAGYFLVGEEKTPIPEVESAPSQVALKFSEYGAEMHGDWNGGGLTGDYMRIRSTGTKSFKFTAAPERQPQPAERVDIAPAGNYQVDETTVARLWKKDGGAYGTFIATDGDYGLLAGRLAGRGVQFNRFTGWQAISIILGPAWNGTLQGKYYAAANDKPQELVLRPRSDLNLELPAAQQTVMKDSGAGFSFSGVSLDGATVRNTDERFKGKALILDIMGTWCHNCLDEAPLLEQLQREYGKDGLEIVGLSFEINADPVLAKKNLQLFKDRFGLTYTLLFCGSLDDENVKAKIQGQLEHFFAYPTTVFLDKSHQVQFIHSGFNGPGTGDRFQAQQGEFRDLVNKLGLYNVAAESKPIK
ncbi:MAG TPA: TlpA disulfide reductase family protein [Terriglobia bacterium]|jgi:thiol-disulfide isomerase/thioredoxin